MALSLILCITFAQIVASDPIYNLEIDWIMQGYDFGFQGFMVEFLGFSAGLRKLMPQMRIMQGSFKNSLEDSPIKGDNYWNELFPEEADYLKEFMSPVQKLVDSMSFSNEFVAPTSQVFLPTLLPDDICTDTTSSTNTNPFMHETKLIGGDLNRPYVPGAHTPRECCQACLKLNNCVAWTYSMARGVGCHLKGYASQIVAEQNQDSISGIFSRSAKLPQGRITMPKVQIFHGTTCYYRNESTLSSRDINVINVGRYMLERAHMQSGYGLDEYFVISCAGLMDELWVPTEWHERVFRKHLHLQGVYNVDIAVIPEAVDTSLFDPAVAEPKAFRADSTGKGEDGDGEASVGIGVDGTGTESKHRRFEFLSTFKWEYRKGWDILLDAYWQAFSKDDNVLLRLRSYIPRHLNRAEVQLDENIYNHVAKYAMESLGVSLSELAPVVWETGGGGKEKEGSLDRALTRMEMRDLLASADAFVLPTRGEGWGLPVAEAMSMGLPIIVSNSTGPAAYCNDDNAYLIKVADEPDHVGYYQPVTSSLVEQFKAVLRESQVVEGQLESEARRRGRNARKTMQDLSPESIVAKMNLRIRSLVQRRGWMTI